MQSLLSQLHVAPLSCLVGMISKGPTRLSGQEIHGDGAGFDVSKGRANRAEKTENPGRFRSRR